MASIEAVTVPKWGMTMTEGTILQWLVDEGGQVSRGQELLEIETTKVTNVVEAAAAGTLRRIVLQEGTTAPVGALAGVIADEAATPEEIDAFIASYADRLGAEGFEAGAAAPRVITVGEASVNVLETGSQSESTVVFLHGFGGDLSTWLFTQPAIAETHRTVAVDLPGHGASSPVAGDDVLARVVSTVRAALDEVAPGRLHLVGHSFGGAVAAAIAAAAPERVASLTLIAPIGLGATMSRDFLVDFVAAERRRPLLGVLERLFADPSRITSDMVEGTLRFKRLEGVPETLSSIADTIADDNGNQRQSIAAIIADLSCPVMLIWGQDDAIVPIPNQTDIPANAKLTIIHGVGHMPQMEAATTVNTNINQSISQSK